jgi:hypothetical protein
MTGLSRMRYQIRIYLARPAALPVPCTLLDHNDGLREFEQDLHQHIHLANNVLFPRAIELEEPNCYTIQASPRTMVCSQVSFALTGSPTTQAATPSKLLTPTLSGDRGQALSVLVQ